MRDVAIEVHEVDVPAYGRKMGTFIHEPDGWVCIEIDGRTAGALFAKVKKEGKNELVLAGRYSREESARNFLSLWGESLR